MTTPQPLRRRLDILLLRWQARLDAEWADRVLPGATTAALFIWLAALSLARHRGVGTGLELASWQQASHLINEGFKPTSSLIGTEFLAVDVSLVLYPLAAITRFLPTGGTLLLLQSAAIALGVLPLWWLCRSVCHLRAGASGTVLLAYVFYPSLHSLNLADFQAEALALPFLFTAVVAGLTGRWRWFWPLVVVVLACRADLGLAIGGLGLLFMAEGKPREGIVTAVVGFGWAMVAMFAISPLIGAGGFLQSSFPDYGDTAPSVLWGMVTDPLSVAADLFPEENFLLVVLLLAPVLFLPLVAFRYLLPAVPNLALILLADLDSPTRVVESAVPVVVFVFVAVSFGVARIGERNVERVFVDRRVLSALALASVVFFVSQAPSSPYREPWGWGGRDELAQARIGAADLLVGRPELAIRAPGPLLPLLAERPHLLPLGDESPVAARVSVDARVVIVDSNLLPTWAVSERQVFATSMQGLGYELIYDEAGVAVWSRAG
ncbi:MAG: DUF2079 domain-containing protein [Actinomycetia bacterium]|nr:DUF2079 domain-containing protein [Actinomycetes bacterium]